MENKLKHLEFIQGVINRLASNSFHMKGWSVVLVAAILVLLAREGRLDAAFIAFGPALVFWGLDGYFLWQERLYRALYDHVRTLDERDVDLPWTRRPSEQPMCSLGPAQLCRERFCSSMAHYSPRLVSEAFSDLGRAR